MENLTKELFIWVTYRLKNNIKFPDFIEVNVDKENTTIEIEHLEKKIKVKIKYQRSLFEEDIYEPREDAKVLLKELEKT